MSDKKGLQVGKMAGRILHRKDNLYKKEMIVNIINMYMDECRIALMKGERVQLSGIGTIIPEVKTHRNCALPTCDNSEHEGAPYTRIRMTRCKSLFDDMNNALLNNIENGVYGLEKLSFDTQQIGNLKRNGYILDDSEDEDYEEGED